MTRAKNSRAIRKVKGGYKLRTRSKSNYSKHPQSRAQALRQVRAITANRG
jgi:hypothetical protein